MDKIAQKFTAQEMIKANAAAEEKEMKRLRLQVAEYDTRIQEIRKLNLKNLELADQLQAMIEAEHERLRKGAGEAKAQEEEPAGGIGAALEENRAKIEDMSEKLMLQTKQLTMAKLETMEKLDALAARLDSRAALEGISAKLESRPTLDEIAARLDQSGALEELAARLDQSGALEELAAKLDCRGKLEELSAKLESRPTLDEIAARLGETPEAGGLEAKLAEVNAQLTEHVHKENVKVYRNVQAAVVDENKKLAEALAVPAEETKAQLAGVNKKVSGLKALTVLALVASLANLLLWVAEFAGLLPTF